VMRVLFPHRYCLIAHKCTAPDRQHRYANCARVRSAIRRANQCRLGLPILLAIIVLLACAYTSFIHWREAEHLGTMQQIDSLKATQHDQVNTLQLTIDSLNTIVEQQSIEARGITHTMDSIKTWNRKPSAEEKQAFYQQTENKLLRKREEIIKAAQSGMYNNIKDRKTFYAPIDAWLDSEKSQINNKDLLEDFENTINHAYYFWETCEDIYRNLPLVANE